MRNTMLTRCSCKYGRRGNRSRHGIRPLVERADMRAPSAKVTAIARIEMMQRAPEQATR
jgi:hypothetical protein